jgi:hypothetical protein
MYRKGDASLTELSPAGTQPCAADVTTYPLVASSQFHTVLIVVVAVQRRVGRKSVRKANDVNQI